MSELIIVDYHDPLRAGQVLATLRRLHPGRSDLEGGVVLIKHASGKARLQPAAAGSEGGHPKNSPAQRVLTSLLAVLFPPASSARGCADEVASSGVMNASRRKKHLGLAEDFIQRARVMIRPGDSALLLLAQSNPDLLADEISRYGGRLLQTTLAPHQEQLLLGAEEFRQLTDNRI